MSEAKVVLVQAFRALGRAEKANLRWHVANGTPIFCGEGADSEYVSPDGYG